VLVRLRWQFFGATNTAFQVAHLASSAGDLSSAAALVYVASCACMPQCSARVTPQPPSRKDSAILIKCDRQHQHCDMPMATCVCTVLRLRRHICARHTVATAAPGPAASPLHTLYMVSVHY